LIPKSFIQDLLNRLDIVDVVERYVPLKKAGANYVACCPFHNEKSPSFTVSQTKQFYHCFGCGAHGTAIGFVMEHAGMGYVDAIEDLARSAGLDVPHERAASDESHKIVSPDLYEVMMTAMRYYREQLKASQPAIDYLKRRGLSGEVAARFGIGYSPDGWQSLAAAFLNYQGNELEETGLVISGDNDKRYDRFRERIMFPIVNTRGNVIGFGGRILDKGEPKYLNSPETPLFEKGRELYGLFQSQKAIRAAEKVLVVEGYMDVVVLAQHGVGYAVATLGTATTPYHVQKLLRLVDHIVFSFDGDKAGRRAAWRALENALPYLQDGKRISFLFLPAEHDPDSFIREFGKDVFEQRIDEAMPLSTYLLREISSNVDMDTQEGRSQFLEAAKPLLTAIVAPTTGLLLRKEVAALSGVSQAELEALYKIKPVARAALPSTARGKLVQLSPQHLLLQCLISQPTLGQQVPDDWHGEGVESEAIAAILLVLRENDFAVSSSALIQFFQGTSYESQLVAAQVAVLDWGEDFDVALGFSDALKKMHESKKPQQRQALESKFGNKSIRDMNAEEREEYKRLLHRS